MYIVSNVPENNTPLERKEQKHNLCFPKKWQKQINETPYIMKNTSEKKKKFN